MAGRYAERKMPLFVHRAPCTVFSCFLTGKGFANTGRLLNLRARVKKCIGDVCVKKISAASKLWKLKRMKEGKFFFVIFMIADCYLTVQK
jgi:hypothetical protein